MTFPLSFVCMGLTFKISGDSFALFPSTLIGTLPVALALANNGTITGAQASLAVMLSISMVGSLAKLEVFSENMRQVKFTVESLEGFLEMPELPQPSVRADVKHTDAELVQQDGLYRRFTAIRQQAEGWHISAE